MVKSHGRVCHSSDRIPVTAMEINISYYSVGGFLGLSGTESKSPSDIYNSDTGMMRSVAYKTFTLGVRPIKNAAI